MPVTEADWRHFAGFLKEKFPEYKGVPDTSLVDFTADKYPEYQQFSTGIKQEESAFAEFLSAPRIAEAELGKQATRELIEGAEAKVRELGPPALTKGVEVAGRVAEQAFLPLSMFRPEEERAINRLMGPVRAKAAGKSFLEGLRQPEAQPNLVQSFTEKLKAAGKSDVESKVLGLIGGTLGEIAVPAIALSIPMGVAAGVRGSYIGAQRGAMRGLRTAIFKEARAAGLTAEDAMLAARAVIDRQLHRVGALRRAPWAINQATKMLKQNEGMIGGIIKELIGIRKRASKAPAISARLARELPSGAIPLQITEGPTRGLYYELLDGSVAQVVNGKLTPIDPLIIQQAESKGLVRRPRRKRVLPTGKKAIELSPSIISETEITGRMEERKALLKTRYADLKKKKSEELARTKDLLTREAEERYLDALAEGRPAEVETHGKTLDAIQEELSKRLHGKGLGQEGYLNLALFDDVLNNLIGIGQQMRTSGAVWAKKVGIPYYVAMKYPATKPVYDAVSGGAERGNEQLFEFLTVLDPVSLRNVSKADVPKLTQVLKLGNDVGEEFSDSMLTLRYGMNENQIIAYRKVRAMYDSVKGLGVDTAKVIYDYDQATPEQQVAFDSTHRELTARGGYLTQQRLEGDWAVFKPGPKDNPDDYHWAMLPNRAEAIKVAEAWGVDPKIAVSHRRKFVPTHGHLLTLEDLNGLVDSAGLDATTTEISALKAAIRARSLAAARATRRKNIKGYWTGDAYKDWDLIIKGAIQTASSAAHAYGRAISKVNGGKAFREVFGRTPGDSKEPVDPALREYWDGFMRQYLEGGSGASRTLLRFLYVSTLGARPRLLFQDLATPLLTTWADTSKYWPTGKNEVEWMNAYKQMTVYVKDRLAKVNLSEKYGQVEKVIRKLEAQGIMGQGVVNFMLGGRQISVDNIEQVLYAFMRWGEGAKRIHAAFVYEKIAREVKGITDFDVLYDFVKERVKFVSVPYSRVDLPSYIGEAGIFKFLARNLHVFNHFTTGYLQAFAGLLRGTPGQKARAIAALFTLAGVKGMPWFGLVAAGYAIVAGATLESDARRKLRAAGVPNDVADFIINGPFSVATGIEGARLFGMGDAVSTYGSPLTYLLGAPGMLPKRAYNGIRSALRGDFDKAMEDFAPIGLLRDLLKANRMLKKGVTTRKGELLGTIDEYEAFLIAMGMTPQRVTNMYNERSAKIVARHGRRKEVMEYNLRTAHALFVEKDYGKAKRLMFEAGKKGINVSMRSINLWWQRFEGYGAPAPAGLEQEFKEIAEVFAGRRRGRKGVRIK